MKKFRFISFAAIAIAMSASCAKVNPEEPQAPQPKEGMVAVTLNVSAEETTKADLNGLSVEWKVGDKIAVYDCISPDANEFVVTSANGTSATISGEVTEGTTDIYAVSPYSAAKGVDVANKTVDFKLTQPQTIPEGANIAPEALVQVAKATIDSEISFKNVVSLVKFTISAEDVTDVLIVSNGSEKFIGDSKAVFDADGNVTTDGQSMYRMKVSPASGLFAPGEYYTAVLPSEATTGLTFASTGTECKYIKSTDKTVNFQMRKGLNFGDITDGETIPLIIKTKADLDKWAANVKYYLKSDTIKLANDIDCGGVEWEPVQNYYGGVDGQNHSIYNIKITASKVSDPKYLGFFYSLVNDNVIKDLSFGCIDGAYDGTSSILIDAAGSVWAGSLVGLLKNTSGADRVKVTNVSNYIPITIKKAATETTGCNAAGIIGRTGENTKVDITGCKNYGAIKNTSAVKLAGQYYSGIVGIVGSSGQTITDCHNYAEMNLSSVGGGLISAASFAGGIVARVNSVHGVTISGCTNSGKITVGINAKNNFHLGGIVGFDNTAVGGEGYDLTIIDCRNSGTIGAAAQSNQVWAGGIIGCSRSKIRIAGCTNTGKIYKDKNHNSISGYAGILAMSEGCEGAIIEDCTNSGVIVESGTVNNPNEVIHAFGGIVGICNIDVRNCSNSGNITVVNAAAGTLHCAGGIAGYCGPNGKTDRKPVISGCTNSGNLTTTLVCPTGGLIGKMVADLEGGATLTGCSVNCTVTPGTAANGGMIVGSNEIAATFGTAASPVTVAGTFNGTALDASNYTGFLYGSSTVTPTVNATLAE